MSLHFSATVKFLLIGQFPADLDNYAECEISVMVGYYMSEYYHHERTGGIKKSQNRGVIKMSQRHACLTSKRLRVFAFLLD